MSNNNASQKPPGLNLPRDNTSPPKPTFNITGDNSGEASNVEKMAGSSPSGSTGPGLTLNTAAVSKVMTPRTSTTPRSNPGTPRRSTVASTGEKLSQAQQDKIRKLVLGCWVDSTLNITFIYKKSGKALFTLSEEEEYHTQYSLDLSATPLQVTWKGGVDVKPQTGTFSITGDDMEIVFPDPEDANNFLLMKFKRWSREERIHGLAKELKQVVDSEPVRFWESRANMLISKYWCPLYFLVKHGNEEQQGLAQQFTASLTLSPTSRRIESFQRRRLAGTKLDKNIFGTWMLPVGDKSFVFKETGEAEFPIPSGTGKDQGSFITKSSANPKEIDYLMSGRSEWFLGIYDVDSKACTLKLEWGNPPNQRPTKFTQKALVLEKLQIAQGDEVTRALQFLSGLEAFLVKTVKPLLQGSDVTLHDFTKHVLEEDAKNRTLEDKPQLKQIWATKIRGPWGTEISKLEKQCAITWPQLMAISDLKFMAKRRQLSDKFAQQ